MRAHFPLLSIPSRAAHVLWFSLLALLALGLQSCAKSHPSRAHEELHAQYPDQAEPHRQSQEALGWLDMPASSVQATAARGALSRKEAPSPPAQAFDRAHSQPAGGTTVAPELQSRMVYYEGRIRMRATEPERIKDSALAIVEAAGGYLETRESVRLVLRVPVSRFDSVFHIIAAWQGVLEHSRRAEDITAAHQDAALRKRILEASLARYRELVQKATDDKQRLQLLSQIKQLREELGLLEQKLQYYSKMAAFSQIVLEVLPHMPVSRSERYQELSAFRWIHDLDPFAPRNGKHNGKSGRLEMAVPLGMVALEERRPWQAVSADGTKMWSNLLPNRPDGDSRFWHEAIKERLAEGFDKAHSKIVGDWVVLRLVPHSLEPYIYWVGVRVVGEDLQLVEIYFPDVAQESRYADGVVKVLELGGAS